MWQERTATMRWKAVRQRGGVALRLLRVLSARCAAFFKVRIAAMPAQAARIAAAVAGAGAGGGRQAAAAKQRTRFYAAMQRPGWRWQSGSDISNKVLEPSRSQYLSKSSSILDGSRQSFR
ncbi:hypothetical protein NPIL_311891 [Nephila pilipes]|uniref:Uncharacterized protein n=1 Tax=Nephila pilipes TaxID=299642 RepID=A0A8X6TL96_NEPPI|nr:hypothetical protein NPIL_311891 [Nephila pilipes]